MANSEDQDSGMESLTANSKDQTPEKVKSDFDDLDDDEDLDETLGERLWGLTEMFPESVRNTASTITRGSINGTIGVYKYSRTLSWIFFSSSIILIAPLIFEIERSQMLAMALNQQKSVLLGPASAVTAGLR